MRLVTCWYRARHLLSLFPPPSFFYMNSIDSSTTKEKRKGSLCTRHTAIFLPPLWNRIQKSHAIKMSLFHFFFKLMPSKIARFSFTLYFPEGKKQQSAVLKGEQMRKGLLWVDQKQKSCCCDCFKSSCSCSWLSLCDGIKSCPSYPQVQPHSFTMSPKTSKIWLKN